MKRHFAIILFLFTLAMPAWAQDFFHFNATNSYSWSGDGFDYVYKEVTVPLTDNDPTHTFTKLQHWHIPFAQISSVDFANTGSASNITVAVMLKSQIAYQNTESSYHGDENNYTDHSIVCYVRFFKTWQDGKGFIDYIKRHIGNPPPQLQRQVNGSGDSYREDTSWSGKKVSPNGPAHDYNPTSVALEGSSIHVYHYY